MSTGQFIRDRLPDWLTYADREGIRVEGRGKWRSILCDFHDDSHPSLRIHTESGGWCCMSCGASGGDVLSHYMRRTGLDFIDAAKALDAWDANGANTTAQRRLRTLSAHDGLALIYEDSLIVWICACDMAQGRCLPESTRASLNAAARRILFVAEGSLA